MTKTRTPDETDPLSVKYDEESRVRAKPASVPPPDAPSDQRFDSSRPQRLARVLRFSKLILDMLPNDHPSRRLLVLAITRRDEALLEALLQELYREQKGEGDPATGTRKR